MVASHFGLEKNPGWTVRVTGDGWFVSSVDASGPAAGNIDVGDRLLALSARSTASTGWTAHWDTAGSAPSTG